MEIPRKNHLKIPQKKKEKKILKFLYLGLQKLKWLI